MLDGYRVTKCTGMIVNLLMVQSLFAQEPVFPMPNDPNMLFYVQHSTNPNTVVYEVNYKNDVLDPREPIHIYWRRYEESGQKGELNMLQRNYAYRVDLVLLFKKRETLQNFGKGSFTLGGDISLTAGPFGRYSTASADYKLDAEVYSYSKASLEDLVSQDLH